MAAKKTAAEQGLQQKMKVLAKLFDAGCKTEKDLKALTLPTILKIPDVTVPDMTVITELQEQVAKNRLLMTAGAEERKDIKEENYYGVPMSIVLYQDKDGNTIPHGFITQLDPPPKGFEIIDSPYLPENCRQRITLTRKLKRSRSD